MKIGDLSCRPEPIRLFLAVILCCGASGATFADEAFVDIRHFGAKPDGTTLCTEAIQRAIDSAAARGGGTVRFPPGKWRSGTIVLRSDVTLSLEEGCTLLGSGDLKDYPRHQPKIRSCADQYVNQSLILGEDLDRVAIRGRGCIDGNGKAFPGDDWPNRPFVIRLINCRDVLVEDVTLHNSAMWMQLYSVCDRVTVRGVTLFNHQKHHADGINIDGCHDVIISDCRFDCDDDGICLKSMSSRACENVTINNCHISSHCNAIKMGTHSLGGFKSIIISNCCIVSPRFSKVMLGRQRGTSGISLEIVDGGDMDRITISNIVMRGVSVPLFIRLGDKGRVVEPGTPKPPVGTLRNVICSNIVATEMSPIGCAITGLPGHLVEDVTLSNLHFSFEGGVQEARNQHPIPELPATYPECIMFGTLPAYGLWCRHVKGLRLINVRLRAASPDLRPAVVCDDVHDLDIGGLDVRISPGAESGVRLIDVNRAIIRGCQPDGSASAFLGVEGKASDRIALMGNDLRGVRRTHVQGEEVGDTAVRAIGNLMVPPNQ
ncbi:MAG TPA: glycoside hydrolase [Planctomycetaceae bacterium]|nr:glycoside hydrolase [Planctomycetaceae bacterium]